MITSRSSHKLKCKQIITGCFLEANADSPRWVFASDDIRHLNHDTSSGQSSTRYVWFEVVSKIILASVMKDSSGWFEVVKLAMKTK